MSLSRPRARVRRLRGRMSPGRAVWTGATVGLAVTAGVLLLVGGTTFRSERATVVDALTAVVVGGVLVAVLGGLLLLVGHVLRAVPRRLRAGGVAAVVVVALFFALTAGPWAPLLALLLLVAAAAAGAGVHGLLLVRRRPSVGPALTSTALAVAGVGVLGLLVGWLAIGEDPADPGGPEPGGPYAVREVTYGSDGQPRRAEFDADADVRTPTVDGGRLLERWTGWRGAWRSRWWGYGPESLPLNATVWHPARDGDPATRTAGADGAFPLVLIVHGNAPMEMRSDAGYAYLAADLASRGHVVVSVDQTFLNLSYLRGLDLGGENDARAWLLLEHLRLWRQWEQQPDHPLHGLADLDRIALIGHSRGGEAVATAAAFDQLERYPEDASVTFDAGFGIDAVVAIAPIDGQYVPAGQGTRLHDVSYLALHGGRDGDVATFQGLAQYQRVTFSGDRRGVRAAVWLPDANHGQFNTEWGRRDTGGLGGALLETRGIMAPADQRRVARDAIVAFLDATLHDRADGLAPFTDAGSAAWPPGTITRLTDHTHQVIADFDEDLDPATGTLPGSRIAADGLEVWREEPAPLRWGEQGTNAAVLGWQRRDGDEPPWWRVRVGDSWSVPDDPVLTVTLADRGESPPGRDGPVDRPLDLSIEVTDTRGRVASVALSEHGGVPVATRQRRLKPPLPDFIAGAEPVAQTFHIRLGDLGDDGFDPAELAEVRLVLDGSQAGIVQLEEIGIATAR